MARAGRKRTSKKRAKKLDPWEKPDWYDAPDDSVRTSRQPHRRILAETLRSAEEAESPLGRMLLRDLLGSSGDVTLEEPRDRYDAGTMFAQVTGAYRSVIGAPRDIAGSGRGYPCDVGACTTQDDRYCECLARRNNYMRAHDALARAGRRAVRAVSRVAVYREPIGAEEIVYLIAGLDELVRHFGLTARRRRREDRNAK